MPLALLAAFFVAHHQSGLRTGCQQVFDHPQIHAFAVDYPQPHEVDPVVLTIIGLREMLARHKHAGSAQCFGRIAVWHRTATLPQSCPNAGRTCWMGSSTVPAKFLAPLSAGSKNHCLAVNKASGSAL